MGSVHISKAGDSTNWRHAIVCLLLMLIMACDPIASIAAPASADTPALTITPTRGLPHSTVIVQGHGFTPNTAGNVTIASIKFGGVPATEVLGSIDTIGRLTATCRVPALKGGTKYVKATDSAGISKTTTWTIPLAKLNLTRVEGHIGSLFTVNGVNFVPMEIATITFADTTRTVRVSTSGTFSVHIMVPPTFAGPTNVVAVDTTGNVVIRKFTILASTISVSPDSGYLGSPVQLSATGFPAYSPVRIEFVTSVSGKLDVTPVPTPTVGANGRVTVNFTVPTGLEGTALVLLSAGGITAGTTFSVKAQPTATPRPTAAPAPAVSVSPTSGRPGSSVVVTGTGFPSYSYASIEFITIVEGSTDLTPDPRPRVGADGTLTATIAVPPSIPDAAYVLVTAKGTSAGDAFTVTGPPTPTPAPTPTATPSATPAPTSTPTPTATPAPTPTPWPTQPPARTPTPSPTPPQPPGPTPTPTDEREERGLAIPWWTIGLITGALLILGPLYYGLRR